MLEKAFESILNDPEKITQYKKNPLKYASFMAMYEFSKTGANFSDLPWFSLSINAKSKNTYDLILQRCLKPQ